MRYSAIYAWSAAALFSITMLSGAASGGYVKQSNGYTLAANLYGDSREGKALVEKWCVNCHAVGRNEANDLAPSLQALAANPEKSEGYIRAFLMQPHKPMPPLELSGQQIEDVIAYLRELGSSAK